MDNIKLPPIRGSIISARRSSLLDKKGSNKGLYRSNSRKLPDSKNLKLNSSDKNIIESKKDYNLDQIEAESPRNGNETGTKKSKGKHIIFENKCNDDMIWRSIDGIPRDNKAIKSGYSLFNDSNIILNDVDQLEYNDLSGS